MYTIIGAGLSGLALADHFKKNNIEFEIFEGKAHGGGHIYSEKINGFTWDEGPHVSFAKSDYVKNYFANNCSEEYLEFPTTPTNYYKGVWIPHPAQTNLYAIPLTLRLKIIEEMKELKETSPTSSTPKDYREWLCRNFGETFTQHFSEAYTLKYWTTPAENLATDWIGKRVYKACAAEVIQSADGPLDKQHHYINSVRYPKKGGFYSYIEKVEKTIHVAYQKKVSFISFDNKQVMFEDGSKVDYINLVSTLPLIELIIKSDAPDEIKLEANKLNCTELLIVNVIADHGTVIPNQWIYVYDTNMYSTRINFTELLSPHNGIKGQTGIQVEVYFSSYKTASEDYESIAKKVILELISMKLIEKESSIISYHTKYIKWANVIFDNQRRKAQEIIFDWLTTKGLKREYDDLEPMTTWDDKLIQPIQLGEIILAGRFSQWKYFWTEDCVLRALFISNNVKGAQ